MTDTWFGFLPKTATAPFCPSEVRGAVAVPPGLTFLAKLARFAGPGLIVSVGYMDPGNWATDIQAGSQFGFGLLSVVLLSGLAAMLLQGLSMRVGIAAGADLAMLTRQHYPPAVTKFLWLLAELAIVATDIAEVLGCGLALKLMFGLPLWLGILATGFDTVIVLGLKGQGFRQVEAIILALVATIGLCFALQLAISHPGLHDLVVGATPTRALLADPDALYIAVGILGATVMPHNLYLHSSIVQTRRPAPGEAGKREAIGFATLDITGSLIVATLVNAAILILAATAFHLTGHYGVAEIEDAYRLIVPVTGAAIAAPLFSIALFASGQSATFTGTIAGQVILEGFLALKIPCWIRRVITRGLALIPALAGVLAWGDHAVGQLLVLTQVVLSAQLPFAIFPLLRFAADRRIMGGFAIGPATQALGWLVFALVTAANLWLIVDGF